MKTKHSPIAAGIMLLMVANTPAIAVTVSPGIVGINTLQPSGKNGHEETRHSHAGVDLFSRPLRLEQDESDRERDELESEVIFQDVSLFRTEKFFTKSFDINTAGSYKVTLTDFEFPQPLEAMGINITTATKSLGTLFGPGSFMFDTGPGEYFLSFFGEAKRMGQYGIEISMADTAVPVPAAVWLFGSGLIGLVGVTRRMR